ncbi:secreted protein [Streptomyces lincolnensis]|uniref:Secreted protein n=1 Tax=Streptomyces lincolnensis TaxID=1915 RepID=A0A1B1MGD4_STRLN|nr:hypothetical protein [Streptomyces lincolnensis]ANS67631.1 secreted protein [Streptomyces lincolnensis]AXG54946.1 secreted protein [Streptomyces lincolnensis]QMV09294.1 hypothetical protein GJU35_29045 [Streptomyces lincolnensis]
MSIRFTAKARRGVVALTVAAGLAVGVAGCGGGGGDDKKPETSASASKDGGSGPSTQEGQSDTPLAELKGPNGLLLQVTSAGRDSGGFVTVSGNLKNDSDKVLTIPAQLSGNETEIIRNGRSFGGATLVDSKGKKRYYVLRDTDGRPLTTTGISTVKAGETIPVFMQFPAPPAGTSEVSLQLPMFAPADLTISG